MGGKYYVYIARCSDTSLYVGITSDITDREKRHNAGVGSNYTRVRRPVHIIYTEQFDTRKKAAQREKQLKGWSRKKKEHLILHGHPTKLLNVLSSEEQYLCASQEKNDLTNH